MAVLTAPEPKNYPLLEENEMFEAVVLDVELVPKPAEFLDPKKPEDTMQLKWTFAGRDGEAVDVKWQDWTSTKLSTHEKAKLIPRIKTIDPDAKIGKTFDTDTLIGKGCRILNKHKRGKKAREDGTFPVYNTIGSLLPSKLSAPPRELVDALIFKFASGANDTPDFSGEDIPF